MKKLAFSMVALLLVCGCFTAQNLTDESLVQYDKHTKYTISDETDEGFTLTVYYGRYQFFTSRGNIAWDAFDKLKIIAREIAQEKGKKIKPVKQEELITSYGRNAMTSTTYCHCQTRVRYTQED